MPDTSKVLVWDKEGERTFETGVKKCALYVRANDGSYPQGVAWSGITGITLTPEGAEATELYADNIKYLNLMSAEKLNGTITCYTYPDAWKECNGVAALGTGVTFGQQNRKTFGLAFQTQKGNDTEGNDHAYILHLVYGAIASPSEKGYKTINDSPEAIEFSYAFKTTPTNVAGGQPTSLVEIDSDLIDHDKLAIIEKNLFGHDADPDVSGDADITAHLLTPNQIADILNSQG